MGRTSFHKIQSVGYRYKRYQKVTKKYNPKSDCKGIITKILKKSSLFWKMPQNDNILGFSARNIM